MIFSVFQKNWVFGILGPPYCGIGATIRIGREMLCLPYAGFLITSPVLSQYFPSTLQVSSSSFPVLSWYIPITFTVLSHTYLASISLVHFQYKVIVKKLYYFDTVEYLFMLFKTVFLLHNVAAFCIFLHNFVIISMLLHVFSSLCFLV